MYAIKILRMRFGSLPTVFSSVSVGTNVASASDNALSSLGTIPSLATGLAGGCAAGSRKRPRVENVDSLDELPRVENVDCLEELCTSCLDDLCASKGLKAAAKQLVATERSSLNNLQLAIRDMLEALAKCRSTGTSMEIDATYCAMRKKVVDAICKIKRGKWASRINLSELLSKLTFGLVVKNYAPTTDCAEQGSEGSNNRIPRDNVCIRTFVKDLLNSLLKEAGVPLSLSACPSVVTFVDACSLTLNMVEGGAA